MTYKLGGIAYTNTTPFLYEWPNNPFELVTGVPRHLARQAEAGDIVGGPLPITECWALESGFEPVANFGIAVSNAANSVFVLSRRPFRELNGAKIGLTGESSASVRLLQVLLQEKYRFEVTLRRGFANDDDARLVIGDQALQFWNAPLNEPWAFLTDLATEWWTWKQLPFVFARWVVRRDLPLTDQNLLVHQLRDGLKHGFDHLNEIAAIQSARLGIPTERIVKYLRAFIYELGLKELESIKEFRRLAERIDALPALSPK